jgi:hypothetical protein
MLNLFVNYDCNLACDYCFVRGQARSHPLRIDDVSFERFCEWLVCHRVPVLGILGGEPTLHPDIAGILTRLHSIGVASVLFTNALYPDEPTGLDASTDSLAEVLAAHTASIVVNYNEPQVYPQGQWERAQRHIGDLVAAGAKLSFSKNFSRGHTAFDYLIEGCQRFGVTRVRYDVSRPNRAWGNNHFASGEEREVIRTLLAFTRRCEEEGILTGLDCCLPLCDFTAEELVWLKEHSMRFAGICQPSLDVQTDLSVSYCMPLSDVSLPDVCAWAGEMGLLCEMNALVRARRESRPPGCEACACFARSCQGGCLALRDCAGCRECEEDTARCSA